MALLGKDEAHKRKIQESREPTEPIYSTAPALNILLTPERPSTSSETPAKIRRKSSSSEKSSWSAESQQSSDKMLEDIERLFLNHETSCESQTQFTRLPCSAHKVHLVSDKSINPKHISFGHSIKKLHCQVQNILKG